MIIELQGIKTPYGSITIGSNLTWNSNQLTFKVENSPFLTLYIYDDRFIGLAIESFDGYKPPS